VSINRELGFLRHLNNKAIDWEKAALNPVKKVKFDREDNSRVRWLTVEEEERLLAQCVPQLKPLVINCLAYGI
jgi:hypothetical protein